MLIFVSLILFFSILVFFGWQAAAFFLKEKRIYVLAPLGTLLGISGYVFLLNALSYFIPVKLSFYLVLGLAVVFGLLFWFLGRGSERPVLGLPKKQFLAVGAITAIIMISSGLVALRALEYDDTAVGHINLAPTISEGNFPVRHILDPSVPFAYHYAPELFTAAIFKITGLPVEFGYDLQIFIFSGLIFLMGFLLIYEFVNNYFLGAGASFLMLFGGGFAFINFFKGLPVLYQKFILRQEVFAPWHFLNGAINTNLFNPLIATIHNHSGAMGIPMVLGIIFLYFRAIKNEAPPLAAALLAGVLLGFLALSAETYFAVLSAVLLLHPFLIFILQKDRGRFKKIAKISGIVLLIGIPIALFQGGVITEFVRSGSVFKLFSFTGSAPADLLKEMSAPSFNPMDLFINFGISILLFPFALPLLRKYFRESAFFILLIVVSFFAPFFIHYSAAPAMKRFFFLTEAFLNLIAGLYLCRLILRFKTEKKNKMAAFAAALAGIGILGGLIWQAAYIAFPIGNIGRNKPFLGRATQMSGIEKQADRWIKNNTAINDVFFAYYKKSVFNYPATEFSALHGRFAPMEILEGNEAQTDIYAETPEYDAAVKDCDSDFFRYHNIKYLYVTPQWPDGLEEICGKRHKLELVFELKIGDDFRRIYKRAIAEKNL